MDARKQNPGTTLARILIPLILAGLACSLAHGFQPEGDAGEVDTAYELEMDEEEPGPILLPPAGGEPWVQDCDDQDFNPITHFEILTVPEMGKPDPRVPFQDPIFGTCLVRVTDTKQDRTQGDPSGGMKNEYARVQAFNADGSLVMVFTTEGNWYLYDSVTLQPLGQVPIWHEPRWDPNDPDLLYYSEETRLMSYRLSSGENRLVHEFADDFPGMDLAAVWTKYEGSPSADGRYWGLMAEDQDWMTVALLIYDVEADNITAMREVPPSEIDSVTISPLGHYFLAFYDNYCQPGQLGSDLAPCGFMVYDQNLENGRGLLRIVGHADPVLDAAEKEVLVYQDIDTDHIAILDLASGEITQLLPIDFSHSAIGLHFSGQAYQAPGWVLVSTSNGTTPASTWMEDQIFAVELVPGGQVVRLAHTHSVYDERIEHDYWAEPHASVNRDFTRIVFTSNWGKSGSDEVEMYMIHLPEDWRSKLP